MLSITNKIELNNFKSSKMYNNKKKELFKKK